MVRATDAVQAGLPMKAGYYHIIRDNSEAGAPDTVMIIEGEHGQYVEPTSRVFDKLAAGDMHDRRNVDRFHAHDRAEREQVKRDQRLEREQRHEHLTELVQGLHAGPRARHRAAVDAEPGRPARPWGTPVNLSQARDELKGRGFDYLSEDRLTIMLNNAKNQFEDVWMWPWLEQTRIGPAPMPVPGLKFVYYVQDTDHDTELIGLDVRQIAQSGSDVNQAGTPAYWWLDGPTGGQDIVLVNTWPVAPVALEARVVIDSPELATGTDTPLIPVRYHPLWIDYAVIEAYKDSDNYSAAQALRADIGVRINDLIARYETRNRQHSVLNSQYVFHDDD